MKQKEATEKKKRMKKNMKRNWKWKKTKTDLEILNVLASFLKFHLTRLKTLFSFTDVFITMEIVVSNITTTDNNLWDTAAYSKRQRFTLILLTLFPWQLITHKDVSVSPLVSGAARM